MDNAFISLITRFMFYYVLLLAHSVRSNQLEIYNFKITWFQNPQKYTIHRHFKYTDALNPRTLGRVCFGVFVLCEKPIPDTMKQLKLRTIYNKNEHRKITFQYIP